MFVNTLTVNSNTTIYGSVRTMSVSCCLACHIVYFTAPVSLCVLGLATT